jgi:uncharacterized cofD-like protein
VGTDPAVERQLMRSEKRVVVIGGGTGICAVLNGLKRWCRDLTAVVTMADDGGSSGRLRDEFGHLPPGDTRRCLIALSTNREVSRVLRSLFDYRFDRGDGLNGHSFGNLFLTALTEITGGTEQALVQASKLLNVRGRVLPVTLDHVRLCAQLEDGTVIWGERDIDVRSVKLDLRIRRVFLTPGGQVFPPAAEAIKNADILVLGPGDLYTSLIPNLMVEGVPAAIRACRGVRIYVCNLMTKRGETDNFAASDFAGEVVRYSGGTGSLDWMIVNTPQYPGEVLEEYAKEGAAPVAPDLPQCREFIPRVLEADVALSGSLLRHDPRKLARVISRIAGSPGEAPATLGKRLRPLARQG